MKEDKNWPIYFKDNLVLGNPKSEVAIVALWTPVKKITEKLDKGLFCLAGQLYSKDGINYIIRNILANPVIHYLVICGQDLSGAGKALIDFFEKGIDKDYNIIDNDFAQIHKEIPKEAIGLLRKSVKIKNLIGTAKPKEIAEIIRQCPFVQKPFAEPRIFKKHKNEAILTLPSEESLFKVREKYIGPAWLKILDLIFKFGIINPSFYGNKVRELFNIGVVISEENPFLPNMFPYMRVSKEDIKKYQASIMRGDKGEEIYTYGERLWNYKEINQVEQVIIPFLKKYPSDRAALAVTFDMSSDHKAPRSPCMCLVQATGHKDKINLTAYFRSHAIFSGWALNAFGLRHLQYYVAQKLSKKPGLLTIFSNCAHIYDNEWSAAKQLLSKYRPEKLGYIQDPRGHFIVNVKKKEIVVRHYSPQGRFLQEFRQDGLEEKAALKMYNKLIIGEAVSEISHAFDLGAELQKAEIAVKNDLKYVQDKELVF